MAVVLGREWESLKGMGFLGRQAAADPHFGLLCLSLTNLEIDNLVREASRCSCGKEEATDRWRHARRIGTVWKRRDASTPFEYCLSAYFRLVWNRTAATASTIVKCQHHTSFLSNRLERTLTIKMALAVISHSVQQQQQQLALVSGISRRPLL